MPLRDIVLYLGNKRASGHLDVERDQLRKRLQIQNGSIINASSNQPREYLGQILINLGYLTEDQFNKAFETQKETKVFLGKILSMIGLVSEPVGHVIRLPCVRMTVQLDATFGDGVGCL